MSQGFHKGNIFSFSDDDDEFDHQRPQQNHIAQQSRRDKLRVQQHGLFDAAAATGHPYLEEADQEEEEEDVGIYGPAGTSNMLSEMFNFPAPAFGGLLHHGHTAGLHQLGSTDAVIQLQRPAADSFYGCNSRPDQLQLHHNIITPASSTTWSSVVLADECLNLVGGEVMERQLGASQLQQLEMRRRAENQMRVSRSEQAGGRDHSFFFLNSTSSNINEHQEDELPAPQPFLHQQANCHQQGQLQAHMSSYGPVAALSIFRNSLYARAAQELLEEFCSVGRERCLIISGINNIKGAGRSTNSSSFNPPAAYNPTHIRGGTASSAAASSAAASSSAAAASSSSSKDIPPLSSADRFEGQRKKSKLLSMLDEVERRYNHYCEQMQMVVNSFESAMGLGAATPYTALAHKAMSRHFRCLKDGIAGQLKQTCERLGDKLEAAGALILINGSGGLTKVETPKLRLIDQSLRQQRAFHHHHNLGMMDDQQQQDQPGYWRPQRGLPDRSVTMLRAWLFDHFLHPYPSDADKHLLARQTGLSRNQVSNWFINARVRLWKPMVEDMYQKEAAEDSQQQQQQQQQHNDDHDQTIINSHTSIILSAAATTRQLHDQSISPPAQNPTLLILHTPEYSASPECVPMPRQNLRSLVGAPINSNPQPPQPPENDMYRPPAAMLGPSTAASQARTTTGDLSLTLGLRHAGSLNPPETAAGRFGL